MEQNKITITVEEYIDLIRKEERIEALGIAMDAGVYLPIETIRVILGIPEKEVEAE